MIPSPPTDPDLLTIQDLRVWFPIKQGILARTIGHIRAVDGVSLRLRAGRTLGLVGESGCGKSTLARAVAGLAPIRSGTIAFRGQDMTAFTPAAWRQARRDLQLIFQDPYASLNPRMTVYDIITEGLVVHGLIPRRDRATAAHSLLAEVGLGPESLHRYPHEFSGGQRQRICVARALSMKPRLIICDEAVSALDVSVQAQIINLLADLREKHGLAYLFISHALSVVRHIADDIAVMYLGQIVESGPADAIIDTPRHPYTRALVAAIPRIGAPRPRPHPLLAGETPSAAHPPAGCRFHPRCPFAIPACHAAIPPLVATPDGRQTACIRTLDLPA